MPVGLRFFLLGCVAVALAYVALHTTEPLRLTVGDPWSDAELVASFAADDSVIPSSVGHVSPLAEGTYRAIAALGVRDIGTFRLLAFAVSILGVWLLYQYLRRMWDASVATIGAALFTTSTVWIAFADSLQHPPLVLSACFLALWGLVRAIETEDLRYYAAAGIGSFLCMFAAGDAWLVLAAGVIVTVAVKRGDPLSGSSIPFVGVCALGYVAGIVARGRFATDVLDWQGSVDRVASPLAPTLTIAFTPLVWIVVAYGAWRVVKASSLRAAVQDAMSWLVAVAVLVLALSAQGFVAPTARVLPILPFYAIGGALMIDRLLQGGRRSRAIAIGSCVIAPVWALWMMRAQPRSVLERDDVASTRAYFAYNDGNDFVLTNLLADGVIDAAFDRRSLPALADAESLHEYRVEMLRLFELTDTDHIHAVIFTTPDSRFIDRSLVQLRAMRRRWPVTSWPTLFPDKAIGRIRAYDAEVRTNLEASAARMVLHFTNYDVYRIDRASLVDLIARDVPVAHRIDLSSFAAQRHQLLGWEGPHLDHEHPSGGYTILVGYRTCGSPIARADRPAGSRCEVIQTEVGPRIPEERQVDRAQLLIRVERVCDLRFTVELAPIQTYAHLPFDLASAPLLGLSMNGFETSDCVPTHERTLVVPQQFVHPGINVVTISKAWLGILPPIADLRSIAIDCN